MPAYDTKWTPWMKRLNALRQTNPEAVTEIERRGDEIFSTYSSGEIARKDRLTSRARAMEEALEEYERMVAATGPVEGGMLDTYEPPELELDEDEGRGGIRARLASEAERDALAGQIATGGVEEVSVPAQPFFQKGQDISIQPSPAGVDRTPAFSEAISTASSADRQIADLYIAEIKKDPTARSPKVNGLTIQQQPNAREVQAIVSEYTNSLEYDRAVTAFQQQQVEQPSLEEQITGTVEEAQRTPRVIPELEPSGMKPPLEGTVAVPDLPRGEGGLLQSLAGLGGGIGGWAKENPELLMAGLQTIGELGGQYKRGRREQEASDAEAQERRMSGAISALTRGRVTPEVGRRVPRTTAGEGMFDVLAGIGRGGQEFLEAQRGREEREEGLEMYREDREIAAEERGRERDWAKEDRGIAAEERKIAAEGREIVAEQERYERGQTAKDRKEAFDERLAASGLTEKEKEKERERWEREQGRLDREVGVKERGVGVKEREVAVKEAQAAAASVPKIDTVAIEDANVIAEGFNAMIAVFDEGWASETGTLSWERTYGGSAGIQAEFDGLKTALIGRMKNFQELGRLSDTDYKIILDSLPDRHRSTGWNEGKRRGVFRALEIASGNRWKAPPIPSFWEKTMGGWGVGDEATEVEEVEELPEETEALIERAFDKAGNVVDEDAAEELRQLGLI